jgi:hypothetical protein
MFVQFKHNFVNGLPYTPPDIPPSSNPPVPPSDWLQLCSLGTVYTPFKGGKTAAKSCGIGKGGGKTAAFYPPDCPKGGVYSRQVTGRNFVP